MANFRYFISIIYQNSYLNIFIIFLCFSFINTIISIEKVKFKKVNNELLLNSEFEILPKIHLQEISKTSPNYIIVNYKAHIKLKNTIINLYASKFPIIIFSDDVPLPVCDDLHCFKILNIIGIYLQPSDIKLNSWIPIFHKKWNPRSKIIIWITNYTSVDSIKNLLQSFWKFDCSNVIIIVRNNGLFKFKMYSYNPFIIDNYGRGLIYNLSYNDSFFQNKMQNLHGYNIRISMYHRPPYSVLNNHKELISGAEVEVINTMSKMFNFTPVLITSTKDATDYVVYLNNGSKDGPIGDLLINRSQMLGNAFYVNLAFGEKVEYINPFILSEYVVIVPKNKGVTIIVQLYRLLLDPFYTLIFVSLSFLALYLHLQKEKYAILTSWQLLIFQNFRKFGNNYYDKFFRLLWILWATIISSVYQGIIYRYLTMPNIASDINTLEELFNSGLKLKVGDRKLLSANNFDKEFKKKIEEKAIMTLILHDCYKEFQKFQNVSCGVDKIFGLYYFRKLMSSKYPTAHIMSETLNHFWVTYIVQDGFPFKKQLTIVVNRLIESGLFHKWATISSEKYKLMINSKMQRVESLKLSYLKIIFLFLIFGCTIATLVFILEIIVIYTKNNLRIRYFSLDRPKKILL